MHLSHPLGGARGGRPPSAAREPRYWVLDAPVFASANPAAMSQTKAGNLVSGMSSGMGFVTGSRTFPDRRKQEAGPDDPFGQEVQGAGRDGHPGRKQSHRQGETRPTEGVLQVIGV